jgi:hypothetical protein
LLLLKERPPPRDLASASSTRSGPARKKANRRVVNAVVICVFVMGSMSSP